MAAALARPAAANPFAGRWNLTIKPPKAAEYAAWLEVTEAAGQTKIRMVGHVGGAHPVEKFTFEGSRLVLNTGEWFGKPEQLRYDITIRGGRLAGTVTRDSGVTMKLDGVRAPGLERTKPPRWGEAVALFNGRDLAGWHPQTPGATNWKAEGGLLVNTGKGSNLISDRTFEDFKLHIEFRVPPGSNSGVYLRGRYEIQIEAGADGAAPEQRAGALYGFLPAKVHVKRPAGGWESFDVTLVGRKVTIVHNGVTVIDDEEIPGTTGGALDSHEELPGPLYLQGDHGSLAFRNIVVTPAV